MYDSPAFGLVVAFRGAGENARAAFVVSKKISLKSTVRHQVKRKLSDAVQKYLPRLPKSAELVFLAKGEAVNHRREELEREIGEVLKRAKLL
ncbi:MAG: Ribonuclease P protein component [Microgenomates group bacterium GW2011_GWA1_48_10]|uniref:Uncharacterized protein n=1 Tax=Candidatus Gottesmanbacteria bacterium RIFCSPHIGHO2_01_FULL_47_48 TaxID=1798381 RepID=A0A1F6A4J5_9BACT|nr:MAG: Ribonuclease P protein component [Microgenomates group bacterium GW2011_GWA1_48_10]OGG19650.1 MAG: hypothetical protein A2721_00855 [Candidatus Gottesmanbacteria bacterium RIFCSPHIGHO2_01_FULL_47_48]